MEDETKKTEPKLASVTRIPTAAYPQAPTPEESRRLDDAERSHEILGDARNAHLAAMAARELGDVARAHREEAKLTVALEKLSVAIGVLEGALSWPEAPLADLG